MRISLVGAVATAVVAGLLMAGCGGNDDSSSGSTEPEGQTAATGGQRLEIKMGDYFFAPSSASAKAGKATIEAPNEGAVEHELVVFKTDKNPAKLPTEPNGDVDEEKLDEEAEEAGEVADVEPGETKSGNFDLTPGKYVIFCNIPGHYAQGMYGTLTVTK